MHSGAWGAGACEECRTAALRGLRPPLIRLGDASGPRFLYRCTVCGALWEENWREAHVIGEAEARVTYPQVDIPPRPT